MKPMKFIFESLGSRIALVDKLADYEKTSEVSTAVKTNGCGI
jgi:hypothetical protein